MKKHSNTLFLQFSREVLTNLTMEVKETLVPGFDLPQQKTFTAADLWSIQRRGKNMVQRRFIF